MSNANGSATASNFIPARIEWRGAYGGLPPFQSATPAEIEATYIFSAKALRNSMTRIAEQSQPPTFDNTIAEIDRAWEAFAEAETLYGVFRFSKLDDAMATVQERLAPLRSNLQDWIAQYDKLFARVAAVRTTASLKGAQQRLTELVYADFKKRGGGLPIAHRQRLEEINTRIAKLEAEFQRLLMQDLEKTGHEITDRTDLSGLDPGTCAILEQVAEKRGLAGGAIVPCARPIVDQILVKSRSRSLREAVWRMWEARGRATTLPVVAAKRPVSSGSRITPTLRHPTGWLAAHKRPLIWNWRSRGQPPSRRNTMIVVLKILPAIWGLTRGSRPGTGRSTMISCGPKPSVLILMNSWTTCRLMGWWTACSGRPASFTV